MIKYCILQNDRACHYCDKCTIEYFVLQNHRAYSFCGTIEYMAPEVVEGGGTGHDFVSIMYCEDRKSIKYFYSTLIKYIYNLYVRDQLFRLFRAPGMYLCKIMGKLVILIIKILCWGKFIKTSK